MVALTVGDTPFLVSISPWTIHGWRPFSVSIQPAVFMRKGRITAQTARRRNHFAVARVLAAQRATPPQREQKDQAGQVGHDPHRPVGMKTFGR